MASGAAMAAAKCYKLFPSYCANRSLLSAQFFVLTHIDWIPGRRRVAAHLEAGDGDGDGAGDGAAVCRVIKIESAFAV